MGLERVRVNRIHKELLCGVAGAVAKEESGLNHRDSQGEQHVFNVIVLKGCWHVLHLLAVPELHHCDFGATRFG